MYARTVAVKVRHEFKGVFKFAPEQRGSGEVATRRVADDVIYASVTNGGLYGMFACGYILEFDPRQSMILTLYFFKKKFLSKVRRRRGVGGVGRCKKWNRIESLILGGSEFLP